LTHTLAEDPSPVPGQVGGLGEGSPLQASRQAHQLRSGHILAQGILSRPGHFAFDLHGGRIGFGQIAVDDDSIPGLKGNIIHHVPRQRVRQIHAEYLQLSVGGAAKDLRVRK
jgi:hypothetical protein